MLTSKTIVTKLTLEFGNEGVRQETTKRVIMDIMM